VAKINSGNMPRTKPTKTRRVIKSSDVGRLAEGFEPCLNIKPFETEVVSTPEDHSRFEHNELCTSEDESSEAINFKMPWDDPSQLKFLKSIVPVTEETFHRLFVDRTEDACKEEEKCPQRSEAWHKARAFSVTASQFGASVGHNKYLSRPALLKQKLHPHEVKISPQYIQWGLEHECHAEEAFLEFLKPKVDGLFVIEHPGLLKHPTDAWTACSPDGILRRWENGVEKVELIEYKAPAYHREKLGHPYSKEHYNIPTMYLDQMMGSMWLIRKHELVRGGVDGAWFVVWQPHALSVTYVPYVKEYADFLMAEVESFFKETFVPACVEQINSIKDETILL
jgi:hypothetical protein